MTNSSRRFLLYCPVRGTEYSGEFFGSDRLFDVALNDWTGVGEGLERAEYVFKERGHKWPCAKVNLPKLPRPYDYYAFLDFDIEITTPSLNRLFLVGEALGLDLYQAALGPRSHGSYPSLFAQPKSLVRSTPFVEIMMPVFNRGALEDCVDTFDESESGYGLDHLWGHLLEHRNMAVVDAVVAEHPRPIESHQWRTAAGLTPLEELQQIVKKYGLQLPAGVPGS